MILREFRRRFHRLWGSVLVISIIIYFGYHLISGKRGLIAWRNLEIHMQQRIAHLDELKKEQTRLEQDIGLLKADRVSTDYVEERAKASLGYARPHEVVVLHKR